MGGELESGTIWWDLSRPAASSPRPPQRRANSALLTMSPPRPAGWKRLTGSFVRFQASFPFFSPEVDIGLFFFFLNILLAIKQKGN